MDSTDKTNGVASPQGVEIVPHPIDRPSYTIILKPEPGIDGPRALRQFLKSILRRAGMRCLKCSPTTEGSK